MSSVRTSPERRLDGPGASARAESALEDCAVAGPPSSDRNPLKAVAAANRANAWRGILDPATAASGGAAEGRTVEQPQNVSRKNQRASGILAGGELPFAVGGRWVKSPS